MTVEMDALYVAVAESMEDTPEVKKAAHALTEARSKDSELDEQIAALEYWTSKQEFRNGFACAVRLIVGQAL